MLSVVVSTLVVVGLEHWLSGRFLAGKLSRANPAWLVVGMLVGLPILGVFFWLPLLVSTQGTGFEPLIIGIAVLLAGYLLWHVYHVASRVDNQRRMRGQPVGDVSFLVDCGPAVKEAESVSFMVMALCDEANKSVTVDKVLVEGTSSSIQGEHAIEMVLDRRLGDAQDRHFAEAVVLKEVRPSELKNLGSRNVTLSFDVHNGDASQRIGFKLFRMDIFSFTGKRMAWGVYN